MMLTFRAGKLAALIVSLAVLGACSREQQDWRSAEAADSVEGYGQFLQRHPDSELATEARTRVAQLSEDLEWQRAGSADNADAYKQFLAQHPNGKWAQEARIRIENFALGREGSAAGPPVEWWSAGEWRSVGQRASDWRGVCQRRLRVMEARGHCPARPRARSLVRRLGRRPRPASWLGCRRSRRHRLEKRRHHGGAATASAQAFPGEVGARTDVHAGLASCCSAGVTRDFNSVEIRRWLRRPTRRVCKRGCRHQRVATIDRAIQRGVARTRAARCKCKHVDGSFVQAAGAGCRRGAGACTLRHVEKTVSSLRAGVATLTR